jgi:hypothetical protein
MSLAKVSGEAVFPQQLSLSHADTSTRTAATHADTTMMLLVSEECSVPVGALKCVGRIATVADFYSVNDSV